MNQSKWEFIIKKFVIKQGVLLAFFWSVFMSIMKAGNMHQHIKYFINYFLIAIILFPLSSVMLGMFCWNRLNRRKQEKV